VVLYRCANMPRVSPDFTTYTCQPTGIVTTQAVSTAGVGVGIGDGEETEEVATSGVGENGSRSVRVGLSEVAVATAIVAVGAAAVLVASGSTWATNPCSCTPRITATARVRATRAAAISPLQSGPNPLASPSVMSYRVRTYSAYPPA
jgi:hypothetical protein